MENKLGWIIAILILQSFAIGNLALKLDETNKLLGTLSWNQTIINKTLKDMDD